MLSNRFVSSQNVPAALCRVLSIRFVSSQNVPNSSAGIRKFNPLGCRTAGLLGSLRGAPVSRSAWRWASCLGSPRALRAVGRLRVLVAPRDGLVRLWAGACARWRALRSTFVCHFVVSSNVFVFPTVVFDSGVGVSLVNQVHFIWRGKDPVGVGDVAMFGRGVPLVWANLGRCCSVLRLLRPKWPSLTSNIFMICHYVKARHGNQSD